MNKRIEKLADKAIQGVPGSWNIPDQFCEKFAELIVCECAELAAQEYIVNWLDAQQFANEIRRNFGLKLRT